MYVHMYMMAVQECYIHSIHTLTIKFAGDWKYFRGTLDYVAMYFMYWKMS